MLSPPPTPPPLPHLNPNFFFFFFFFDELLHRIWHKYRLIQNWKLTHSEDMRYPKDERVSIKPRENIAS